MIDIIKMNQKEAAKIIKEYEKLVNEGKAEDKRALVEEARAINHKYWMKVFKRLK